MSILRSAAQVVENRGRVETQKTLTGWSGDRGQCLDIESPQMKTGLALRSLSGF